MTGNRLRRLWRETRGGVTMIGAASIAAGIGCLSFAVDLGAIYLESRRLQGVADAAALAAAGDIDNAATRATRAVADNGVTGARVDTVVGRFSADPAVDPAARFAATATSPDAARVTVTGEAPLFFGVAALGRDRLTISRSATAARANLAAFSIGSRLLSLQDGVANALLSGLTGSKVSLSVMDYDALLRADVDLLQFAEALRTELALEAVSYDDLLATDMKSPRALTALARALSASGADAAAGATLKIVGQLTGTQSLALDQLIDLGAIGGQDRVAGGQSIRINAFDLTRAMLELAGGERQVKLDLGATVPGLLKTTAWLAVGDRPAGSPWLAVSDKGEPIIRTAQTRLYIEAQVGGSGVLGIAQVRLPLYVELAEAEARLAVINCRNVGIGRFVALDVRPAIGHASIADISPLSALGNQKQALTEKPAVLVQLPLLGVNGKARVDLTARDWQRVQFSIGDITAHRAKTVSSNSLVQGIAGSLVSDLDLTVAGLDIGGLAKGIVRAAVVPIAPALDGLVNALTGLLGLHLGEADVRVNGLRCGMPALVA